MEHTNKTHYFIFEGCFHLSNYGTPDLLEVKKTLEVKKRWIKKLQP